MSLMSKLLRVSVSFVCDENRGMAVGKQLSFEVDCFSRLFAGNFCESIRNYFSDLRSWRNFRTRTLVRNEMALQERECVLSSWAGYTVECAECCRVY